MGAESQLKSIVCRALIGAPLLWPQAGFAAPAASAPAVRETQLMLYVSKPLGGSAARSWGLRVDQASAPAIVTSSIALGPLRRRELVNLMVTPHVRTQIEIGGRLTWDLRDNHFSLQHR